MTDTAAPESNGPTEEKVPATKEERIAFIVDLMRRDEWPAWPASRAFRFQLAAKWGCAEPTIRGYAAEAHRFLAIDPEERAIVQHELACKLLDDAETARGRLNNVTGLPDLAGVIKATETAAKFLGIEFEDKVKLSGAVTIGGLAELRQRIRAAKAKTEGTSEPEPDGADSGAAGSGGARTPPR